MKQKAIKPRSTLGKQIASAPNFTEMWQVLASGGTPLSELELITFGAFDQGHDPELQTILKAQFADALFPPLVSGNKKPFKQLLELMGAAIRHQGNLYSYLLEKNKLDTPTKKRRHRLKWELANIPAEDRVSLRAACDYLDKMKVEYRDDSEVWHALQEVKRPLFQPGDRVQWFINLKWSKKKEAGTTRLQQGENGLWMIGKLARELRVTQDGKLVNRGMTREQLSKVSYKCSREVRAL